MRIDPERFPDLQERNRLIDEQIRRDREVELPPPTRLELAAAIEGGRAAKAEIDKRLEELDRHLGMIREAGNQHAVDIAAVRSGLDQLYDIGSSLEADLRAKDERLEKALAETGDLLSTRLDNHRKVIDGLVARLDKYIANADESMTAETQRITRLRSDMEAAVHNFDVHYDERCDKLSGRLDAVEEAAETMKFVTKGCMPRGLEDRLGTLETGLNEAFGRLLEIEQDPLAPPAITTGTVTAVLIADLEKILSSFPTISWEHKTLTNAIYRIRRG